MLILCENNKIKTYVYTTVLFITLFTVKYCYKIEMVMVKHIMRILTARCNVNVFASIEYCGLTILSVSSSLK